MEWHSVDWRQMDWERHPKRFQDLPIEIFVIIVKMLSPKPVELLSPEDKFGLSEESFASVQPLPPSNANKKCNGLSTLRLLCPKDSPVAHLVLEHQFVRVATRFELGKNEDLDKLDNLKGFSRLKAIADHPDIARHVKQFSYMMPRFFAPPQARPDFQHILQSVKDTTEALQTQLGQLNADDRQRSQVQKRLRHSQERETLIRTMLERAEDQRQILKEQLDAKILLHALKLFPNLLQIRLMPLNDKPLMDWERFLDTRQIPEPGLRPSLPVALRHGAQTLAYALQKSGNRASRFSSRAIDLGTIVSPTSTLRTTMSDIAKRLTSLDVQLVYGDGNIDDKLLHLTDLFLLVFEAAVKLQSLHVGFGRRVSIPLKVVFHDIRFENLRHLGIHEWHVHAQELIELLDRHKNSLTSLRLRHVSLKEESSAMDGKWMVVLKFIRLNLKLRWISLRGIGYREDSQALGGMRFGIGGMRFGHTIYGQLPTDDESDSSTDWSDPEPDWSDSDGEGGADLDSIANHNHVIAVGQQQQQHHQQHQQHQLPGDLLGESSDDQEDPMSEYNGGEGEFVGDEEHSAENHSDATAVEDEQEEGQGDSADDSNDDQEDHMSDLDYILNSSILDNDETDDPAQETGQPAQQQPAERASTPVLACYCHHGYRWTDDLGDNGITVTKIQWKRWTKWVERRCQIHDPPPEATT